MHDGATSTLMGNLQAGNGDNTGSSTLLLSLLSLQLRKTEGLRHCCNQCCCHQYKSEHRVLNIVLFAIDVTAIICEWERTRLLSLVIVALSCCGQKRRNKGSQICPMSNAKAPTQCNGLFLMTKTLSSSSSPTPPPWPPAICRQTAYSVYEDGLVMNNLWCGACHHDFEQNNPAPKWLNFEQYSKYLAWDRNWVFTCLSS